MAKGPVQSYLLSVVIAAGSVAVQYMIVRHLKIPVPGILYPSCFLVAWYFGFGPALVSALVGVLGSNLFFFEPFLVLKWLSFPDTGRILIFFITSVAAARIVASGRIANINYLRAQSRLEESEKLFRKVADETPALMWRARADKLCDWFNNGWLEFTGRSLAQELGNGWADGVHPEDRAHCQKVFAASFGARQPFSMEYRLRRRDGQFRWVLDRGGPRFSAEGEFLGFIGTCVEVHEQHTVASELTELQNRFERSAQATDLGIWYCDLPFEVLNWNASTKDHFWLPPEAKVTIETFYERILPEDRDRVRAAIRSSIDGHTAYDVEFRTTQPGDESRQKWIRAIGWTEYAPAGNPIRFDGITLETTRFREVARQRDESLAKAEQAIRIRDEFLSISSHELRTPLTPLKIQLQALGRYLAKGTLSSLTPEQLQRMIDISEKQVSRLTALIDDMLDVSRISSGKLTLNRESVDLVALVREVVERYQPQLQSVGCKVELFLPPLLPAELDQLRVEQVVINLLTNSMRYAPRQPIEISLSSDGKVAQLAVKDHGMGISAENQQRIFGRFERVLSAAHYGGLGLGLFIVQQIVAAHGGTVEVESELGQGARFTVKLPLSV